ncbi:MAG: Flp family type IVb pilin [Reyranellaceae bacterium]
MRSTFKRLIKDDSGATMIEYGLIAALISVAAIVSLTAMGGSLQTMFNTVSTALDTAVGGGAEGGGEGGGEGGE